MATSKKKRTPHPVAVAFGAALREAREKTGKSQLDLGLSCGLDRTYISLLERAINQPSLGTVLLLAEELEISPEVLVSETCKRLSKARQHRFQHPTTSRGIKAIAKTGRRPAAESGRSSSSPGQKPGLGKSQAKSRLRSS